MFTLGLVLQFQDICYRIKLKPKAEWYEMLYTTAEHNEVEKTLLNGITGIVCPGEILAMLGPPPGVEKPLSSVHCGKASRQNFCKGETSDLLRYQQSWLL